MLIKFYNIVIFQEYKLNRWKKIIEVMLEKGKHPITNKLQIIQLIKADFQLIMRIFLNYRKSENIENDTQLSKFNYRLRKYYSIKTILLEKRLIYNFSMQNNYLIIHNMTDLKAYYNMQLLIVLGLIQE